MSLILVMNVEIEGLVHSSVPSVLDFVLRRIISMVLFLVLYIFAGEYSSQTISKT